MNNDITIYSSDLLFDGYGLNQYAAIVCNHKGEIIDLINKNDQLPSSAVLLEGLLMPGMVNAHCHLELSFMKDAIPQHSGLVSFLMEVGRQRNHNTDEVILEKMKVAEQEMIQSGIVAIGDICNSLYTYHHRQHSSLIYHHFIECFGLHEHQSLDRFSNALQLYHQYSQIGEASLVLHAPYSVSPSLCKLVDDFNRNKISTLHNQEAACENELFQHKTGDFKRLYDIFNYPIETFPFQGPSSLRGFLPHLRFAQHLILVHNTCTHQQDIEYTQQHHINTFWCLCPSANKYIEHKLPPVDLLRKNNATIVLGTDSLASNTCLNLWHEIHILLSSFPEFSLWDLLKAATSTGAEALGMSDRLGTFKKHTKPGILHIPSINATGQLTHIPQVNVLHPAS